MRSVKAYEIYCVIGFIIYLIAVRIILTSISIKSITHLIVGLAVLACNMGILALREKIFRDKEK